MRTQNLIENPFIPYSFQGMEHDNEVKGEGNSVNYKYRMCDPRLGRFFAIDPLAAKYPYNGPYNFSENRVIDCGELEGLEVYYAAEGTRLGQIGKSTEVRVINEERIKALGGQKNYMEALSKIKPNSETHLNWINSDKVSKKTGMNEAELFTRAFMSTLKQTENGGNEALDYDDKHMVDGKIEKFTDFSDHPYRGKKGGTAAGAYQILLGTYDLYKKAYPEDILDFSALSQDKLVLAILSRTGALNFIIKGDYKSANTKLTAKPEQFSSLPGGSQESVDKDEFDKLIKKNISNELKGDTNIEIEQGELLKSNPDG